MLHGRPRQGGEQGRYGAACGRGSRPQSWCDCTSRLAGRNPSPWATCQHPFGALRHRPAIDRGLRKEDADELPLNRMAFYDVPFCCPEDPLYAASAFRHLAASTGLPQASYSLISCSAASRQCRRGAMGVTRSVRSAASKSDSASTYRPKPVRLAPCQHFAQAV